MLTPFTWGRRNVLFLALPVCMLSLVYTGPKSSTPVSQSRALRGPGAQFPVSADHITRGRVHDWSTRHALYPQVGTMAALEAARRDPRATFKWQELREQRDAARFAYQRRKIENMLQFRFPGRPGRFPVRNSTREHIDWAINLGSNGTAPTMYPAKYTFDTTAAVTATNCTYTALPTPKVHDFVVFPVNATGGAAQPNIVGLENLYSGTVGGNGICNRAPAGQVDDGVSATVLWSYNVHAIVAGGAVTTSPVLSLDGTKVAFVESAAGNAAHFHVLAWKSGDGKVTVATTAPTPPAFQDVLAPVAITTFSPTAPAAGSGAATDLAFGATTDTLSSPYIDYTNDLAYVGNDAGLLFRFKNVFCTTAACGTAKPSLDTTWGSGTGSVTVCTGTLTAALQDVTTNNMFVGCADGKLYSISPAGVIK